MFQLSDHLRFLCERILSPHLRTYSAHIIRVNPLPHRHDLVHILNIPSALSNVLLITILIAILSNKFAEINANAQEEASLCLALGVPALSYGG
jgi:hypothetical protein